MCKNLANGSCFKGGLEKAIKGFGKSVEEASCAHSRTVRARSSEGRDSLELGMASSWQVRQEDEKNDDKRWVFELPGASRQLS